MANTIKVKRSSVAGKVPTTGDLELGEIAVNTYDGKMYMEKNNGTASVVQIGDVVGAASSTDNALVRFDGTTGKLIQNSTGTLDDSGTLSIAKELVGNSVSANLTRFPNALSVVSITPSGIQQNESLYIGQIAEAVSVGNTWGSGMYGVGYTNSTGTGRGTGVTGEGHVSASSDTGVAVGVRGYAVDSHTGNYNIGLYGDAENGDAGLTYGGNVALFLANGNIVTSSASAKTWYMGGNITFDGQGSAKTIGATNGAIINATNLAGGAANKIVYQTGSGATSFIDAPTTSNTSLTWSGTAFTWAAGGGSGLPSQTGNAGKFLSTDGTNALWNNLPTQLPIITRAGATVDVAVANGYLPILTNGGSTVNVAVS
jgi:hypothetical protein